jgi:hypothetical protein
VGMALIECLYNGTFNFSKLNKSFIMDNVRSGSAINEYYLAIVDKYGQRMTADNSSRISFNVYTNSIRLL